MSRSGRGRDDRAQVGPYPIRAVNRTVVYVIDLSSWDPIFAAYTARWPD